VLSDFDPADVRPRHTLSVEQSSTDPVGESLGVAKPVLSIVVHLLFLSLISQKVQTIISDNIHVVESQLFEDHSIVESLETLCVHFIGDLGKSTPGGLILGGLTELVPRGEGTPVQRLHLGIPIQQIFHLIGPSRENFNDLALASITAPGNVVIERLGSGHVEIDGQVVSLISSLFNTITIGSLPILDLLERGQSQVHDVGRVE